MAGRTPIKLLYVVNSLDPGGTEQLVVQMAGRLKADFEVTVVCLDKPGRWAARLRKQYVPVYCLWRQPGLDLAVALKLARFCRQRQIDIIHAHQCTPWFYAALSRLLYPKPRLLLEEHGRLYPEAENRKRIIFNRVLVRKLTHRFVAVSEDIRRRLVRYEGLDYGEIEVVYNGVAPDPAVSAAERLALRRGMGIGADDFVVGTVGRFDPIKNLPLLIASLARAGEKNSSIKGLLVGDGPLLNDTKGLVDRLGLTDSVVFTGFRQDARRLIENMDLFVLSSFSEGTSMALLEAMAASVPVAVTDVGGNPEIVLNNRTGWIVSSGSVQELTDTILEASFDRQKSRQLAEAARSRYLKRFTFDIMIENYRSLYHLMK